MRKGLIAVAATGLVLLGAARAGEGSDAAAAPPRQPVPALPAPLAAKYMLLDIAQAGGRAVAVGDHGDIVVSDNGGDWRQVDSPVNVMLNRVYFRDANNGWAIGHDGVILHSVDGGGSWALQRWAPGRVALYDILFLDEQNGLVVGGYGTLLHTADGGKTWSPLDADIREPGLHFNAVVRLADGTLFIAGERGMMARSTDGGASWNLLDSPYKGSLFGALPWGPHGVLAFGLRGNIYVADDLRSAKAIPVKGWDEFDRDTTVDPAALAKLGWRHLDNPSQESLLRGAALPEGALLTGIDGVLVQVSAKADDVSLPQSSEHESISGLLRTAAGWQVAGVRGVQLLKLGTGGQP